MHLFFIFYVDDRLAVLVTLRLRSSVNLVLISRSYLIFVLSIIVRLIETGKVKQTCQCHTPVSQQLTGSDNNYMHLISSEFKKKNARTFR